MILSHSKVQKYKQCPRMYDLHYNKKIRSKMLNSPLFFGLACDEAINRLLLDKKLVHTEEEIELMKLTPIQIFTNHLTEVRHNGQDVKIQEYEHVQFSKADFAPELLEDDDLEELGEDRLYCKELFDWYHQELSKNKISKEVHKKEIEFYNRMLWKSLYRKGAMILDAYEKEVMPEIHEVFDIQKKVCLPNSDGDEITGYIDFICSFTDDPSKKYIVDNKSSSKPYKQQDLDESDQLHTYAEDQGIENICYIVYEKNIRKRDPRVRITIWKGKTNEEQMNKTFDNYIEVLDNIKAEEFNPDYDSGCFFFGRKCLYHDICHKEKMSDLLIDLKKEKK